MTSLNKEISALACKIFQVELGADEMRELIIIGPGSEFESILVITFLMELQGILGDAACEIDLFELFFKDSETPITLREIILKVMSLGE